MQNVNHWGIWMKDTQVSIVFATIHSFLCYTLRRIPPAPLALALQTDTLILYPWLTPSSQFLHVFKGLAFRGFLWQPSRYAGAGPSFVGAKYYTIWGALLKKRINTLKFEICHKSEYLFRKGSSH